MCRAEAVHGHIIPSTTKRRVKRETRNTADSVNMSQFLLSLFLQEYYAAIMQKQLVEYEQPRSEALRWQVVPTSIPFF